MIISLNGKIIGLFSDKVILEVSGVGYECFISQQTHSSLIDKTQKSNIKLNIYHHINESNQCLFGFSDLEEKSIFMLLVSVSGIGPKTAIQFLSNTTAKDLEKKIIEERKLSENPKTLEELSKKYKISRERIRQIETRAFEKLQKAMLNSTKSKNLLPNK